MNSSARAASVEDIDIPSRLRKAAGAFAATVAPANPAARVPATPDWTVADLATHVAIESRRYRRELEGHSEWSTTGADIAATNRRALAAEPSRDVNPALDQVKTNVARYASLLAERDLDEPSHRLDGGLLLAPRHAAGLLLGELVLHRRDISRVTKDDPRIDPGDALVIATGAVHTIPGMIDQDAAAGRTAAIELRLRGGPTFGITLRDGSATVAPGSLPRRDAVLSVDPVGFLLASYGRRGQLSTIVRGHVFAWGRRVDRALLLDRVVHHP